MCIMIYYVFPENSRECLYSLTALENMCIPKNFQGIWIWADYKYSLSEYHCSIYVYELSFFLFMFTLQVTNT